ncbi:hypothetical protein UlMin_013272 [Ulmus minor]
MAKTPSPQNLNQIKHKTKSQHGDQRDGPNKNNHKTSSALKYFRVAAKKVAGLLAMTFLLKTRKATSKPKTNGQISGISSSVDLSNGSNKSTPKFKLYEFFGSSGPAGSGNISFEEINKATQKFSAANKLGEGGFGSVYKGVLQNGTVVAVKRAKMKTYNGILSTEFKNEIVTLSMIEHLNLVRLYGYLEHGDERIILVEYVGNGTLREHLNGTRGNGLEISERLDIAIDVAHAITYLHMYSERPIIHRDIKASNILITEKLRAKVADFGFARSASDSDLGATHISTQVKGTAGYLDPEYLRTYQLTDKSDVYSFGVLLVELVTGRHPIEEKKPDSERLTIRWAMQKLKVGDAVLAMDPRLRRNPPTNMAVVEVLKLAQQCLAPLRPSRPSMKECCEVLWRIRKDFREKAFPHPPPPTSRHSSNFPESDVKQSRITSFGIEEDSYKFISA